MPPTKPAYHHGDLQAALLRAAFELLEDGDGADLSLRAVARRAGVSPSATYRHYADREALVSAVAAVGYQELAQRLVAAHPEPSSADELIDVAIAYVRFALDRPALFRIMFNEPCDRDHDQRADAVAGVSLYVRTIVGRIVPDADQEALATAVWALVHGLASLHLDGKFETDPLAVVDTRVRTSIRAILDLTTI